MNDVLLDSYKKCVSAFRLADKAMGSAFRQKLAAIGKARECYTAENGKEWGFVSQFARDTGVAQQYIDRVNTISLDPELTLASVTFSAGANTLFALAKASPEARATALEEAREGGTLSKKRVEELDHRLSPDYAEEQLDLTLTNPTSTKEIDYGSLKNPLTAKKLAIGVTSMLCLIDTEDSWKDLSAKEIASVLLADVRDTSETMMWERLRVNGIRNSLLRLTEAMKYMPDHSTTRLKSVN